MCAYDANHRPETLVRTTPTRLGTRPNIARGMGIDGSLRSGNYGGQEEGAARQHVQVLLGTFSVIVALKGTSPGGPRRRRAFDLERRQRVGAGRGRSRLDGHFVGIDRKYLTPQRLNIYHQLGLRPGGNDEPLRGLLHHF